MYSEKIIRAIQNANGEVNTIQESRRFEFGVNLVRIIFAGY